MLLAKPRKMMPLETSRKVYWTFGGFRSFAWQVVFRDIHEAFGIFHGEMEDLFDGSEIIFGDMLLRALS
jgi:hypothetical protein